MTTNPDGLTPMPGRRREKKKSTTRTVTDERVEHADTPTGKNVRRRTISIQSLVVETWFEQPLSGVVAGNERSGSSGEELALSTFPSRWKLSLGNVQHLDGGPASELDGDYILDSVYADDRQARWEHIFLPRNGLFRASLHLTVSTSGTFQLSAELAGVTPGPRWLGTPQSLHDRAVLKYAAKEVAVAGFRWPDSVEMSPLGWSHRGIIPDAFANVAGERRCSRQLTAAVRRLEAYREQVID